MLLALQTPLYRFFVCQICTMHCSQIFQISHEVQIVLWSNLHASPQRYARSQTSYNNGLQLTWVAPVAFATWRRSSFLTRRTAIAPATDTHRNWLEWAILASNLQKRQMHYLQGHIINAFTCKNHIGASLQNLLNSFLCNVRFPIQSTYRTL